MRDVVVLPGGASPVGSERYRHVYDAIGQEASSRRLKCTIVPYPGHRGEVSGHLTYSGALAAAIAVCREVRPNWLIGRSFGCIIASGLLGSKEDWLQHCEGTVLWGPPLGAAPDRFFPTTEEKRAEVRQFRETKGTFLADDFFEVMPPIENLIANARGDLRIARGSRDTYNSRQELDYLAATHRRMQPEYVREVVEVAGLPHSVVLSDVSRALAACYLDILFAPIVSRA